MNKTLSLTAACGAMLAALAGPLAAKADAVADFYKSRTVTFVSPTGTAGTYALLAQLAQRHLGRHIPGEPTVVPQYMAGAGGTTAANYLYNVAPKDGTFLGGVLSGLAHTQVFRPDSVKYDATKFNWVGAWAEVIQTMSLFHTAKVKTVKDALEHQAILASTGRGSATYQLPALMNGVLGTKFKIVSGYRGGGDVWTAMERGEVDGWCGFYDQWPTSKPEWVRDNKVFHVVQFSLGKHKAMPDVPRLVDLARNDEETKIFRFMSATGRLARGVAAPPGVPADRLAALRKAFADLLKDPEFLAEAERLKIAIEHFPGEAVLADVTEIIGAPPENVARTKAAIGVE